MNLNSRRGSVPGLMLPNPGVFVHNLNVIVRRTLT